MRHIPLAIAALTLATGVACSSDEREASLVPEAQAAVPTAKDYGWKPRADYAPAQEDTAQEYY